MISIISGNLETKKDWEKDSSTGWFIGHFINDKIEFKTNDFEIKWSNHLEGEKKQAKKNISAKSITILIKGMYLFEFPDENKKILLSKRGDFVFWNKQVAHACEAVKTSVLLTIRWPSIPNDQKEV